MAVSFRLARSPGVETLFQLLAVIGPEQSIHRDLLRQVGRRGGQFGDPRLVEQVHGAHVGGAVVDVFGEVFLLFRL